MRNNIDKTVKNLKIYRTLVFSSKKVLYYL